MEQVSPQLQFNFQGSRVNLSLISKLWLLEYITCKIYFETYGLSFWVYKPEWHWVQMCWLGESTHIQLPPPLLERSLSKLINDANMDKLINWLAAWYKIYSDSLCALSLYSPFSPCKAHITFCCKLYFSLQTNSFMSFVYFARNQFIKVFFCQ